MIRRRLTLSVDPNELLPLCQVTRAIRGDMPAAVWVSLVEERLIALTYRFPKVFHYVFQVLIIFVIFLGRGPRCVWLCH